MDMDRIKEFMAKEDLGNKRVMTQPVNQEDNKNNEPSMQAFNTRGGPPPIPEGVSTQQEGDKAGRDALAKDWNKKE